MSYSLQSILDQAPGLIYISDNNTKCIQWCNKNMEEETGYTLAEMRKMGINFFSEVMHPDDFPEAKRAQDQFRQGVSSYFNGFCRIKGKADKAWKWVAGTALPFSFDDLGNIKEVICVFLKVNIDADTPIQATILFHGIQQKIHIEELQGLSPKEKQVIALAIQGQSEKMISTELQIQQSTVEFHLRNIRQKLDVPNMQALISKVKEWGM